MPYERKHHARHCDFRVLQKVRNWRPYRHLAASTGVVLTRWLQMSFKRFRTPCMSFEVHLLIRQSGFRPKQIILVTTLLDPKRYPKAKLAQLYHLRWQATEVNFKHLKTTLNMEMILAKSPQMVRKEIWMHLLAYNLLRNLMWTSALAGAGASNAD